MRAFAALVALLAAAGGGEGASQLDRAEALPVAEKGDHKPGESF